MSSLALSYPMKMDVRPGLAPGNVDLQTTGSTTSFLISSDILFILSFTFMNGVDGKVFSTFVMEFFSHLVFLLGTSTFSRFFVAMHHPQRIHNFIWNV